MEGIELNFNKRYVIIYSIVVAFTNYVINKLDISNYFQTLEIISIDLFSIVFILIIVSIIDGNIREELGLWLINGKRPFECVNKYIKRNKLLEKKYGNINLDNNEFYERYFYPVRNNNKIIAKNSEFCIMRDFSFIVLMLLIISLILHIFYNEFLIEAIIMLFLYIICVISARNKARDFIRNILIENIDTI